MFLVRPVLLSLTLGLITVSTLPAQQKNSTKKIRIEPSQFSGQCGSQVLWRDDVASAVKESASSGKPIFWYVPTIEGSFMDRKPVIDQYMMAGPFAWPAIAAMLNQHFIPAKSPASRALKTRFPEIKTYAFVEPGFLILNPDGSVKDKIDQLTTLDPYWLMRLIAGWAGVAPTTLWSPELAELAAQFRQGKALPAEEMTIPQNLQAEFALLRGMSLFRQGKHDQARNVWASAKESQADHPLAWKAAAEAENWGPFVRGFEVHQPLPDKAYRAGVDSRGSAAPPNTWTEPQLWKQSTDYLLGMQNENGGWLDSDYDFGGTDSLPNVHMAVTALCGQALWESLERYPDKQQQIRDAVTRAANFCVDRKHLNLDDRDEILWAQAYRIRFLAKLVSSDAKFQQAYQAALQTAVLDLESIQTRRGAWYHEYANSFVTATALSALKCAANAGASVDQAKIQKGRAALANDRFASGAFPYFSRKNNRSPNADSGEQKIRESSGRMPICELGLWLWGGSTDERLQFALQSAFENHPYLAAGYKYDNHTSTMAYGGFFFWYDMRSRAEALSFLKDRAQQAAWVKQHRKLVLALPELDGCFVDSHELGRCYGTAMALLTLALLDQTQP